MNGHLDTHILDFFLYKSVTILNQTDAEYYRKLNDLVESCIEEGVDYQDGDLLLLLMGYPTRPTGWPLPGLSRRGRALGIHILMILFPDDPDPEFWMLEGCNCIRLKASEA